MRFLFQANGIKLNPMNHTYWTKKRKLGIHHKKSLNIQPTNINPRSWTTQPPPPPTVLIAHDVQKGLLLSCEGSIWQIFGSGRGSYCEGEFLITTRDTLPLRLGAQPKAKNGPNLNKKGKKQFFGGKGCWKNTCVYNNWWKFDKVDIERHIFYFLQIKGS